MMTTDLAFIGRLGNAAVAAAALAGTVYFISFTIGMGLVSAVAPLAAQAFGARDPRGIRRALRTGLWAGLLISLPIMPFSFSGEPILLALGQAPTEAHLAQLYLFGLVWGVAPALWFMAVRGFMGAVNRPQPAPGSPPRSPTSSRCWRHFGLRHACARSGNITSSRRFGASTGR
jgi:MATE family multidrug resistance protein